MIREPWHWHHLLPQTLKPWFEAPERGLNIEDPKLKVRLDPDKHLKEVHGGGPPRGGLWVENWRDFIKANPHATAQEVLDQLAKMRANFGI